MSMFSPANPLFNQFQFDLIHGPNIPSSYAILLFTASDFTSITSHIHNWVLFLLWLHPFILPGVISPLISSSILGTLLTWGVPLSVSYCFAFSYCSWGSQGKNTEVVCHSLLQWTTFCQTSPSGPSCLGWPHMAWLSFIELDKAVVHVIRLASFLWLCLPSDAFLQHLPSYLGFSYLGRGASLHGCSSKAKPLLLTLDKAYLLTAAPPDLEWGVAPLGPPAPTQLPLLGFGVAPLGCCPWPQVCGSSFRPPPLTSDMR